MKAKVVRVCAWFTIIFYSLTSIAGLILTFTGDFNLAELVAFLMCLLMSATGWYARKFRLPGFKIYRFSKPVAVVSLIFGIALLTLFPILFASLFGFEDSLSAIINLLIMFFPVVISAIAILSSKSETPSKPADKIIRQTFSDQ